MIFSSVLLPLPLRADDADRLAGPHREGDVAQRPELSLDRRAGVSLDQELAQLHLPATVAVELDADPLRLEHHRARGSRATLRSPSGRRARAGRTRTTPTKRMATAVTVDESTNRPCTDWFGRHEVADQVEDAGERVQGVEPGVVRAGRAGPRRCTGEK